MKKQIEDTKKLLAELKERYEYFRKSIRDAYGPTVVHTTIEMKAYTYKKQVLENQLAIMEALCGISRT